MLGKRSRGQGRAMAIAAKINKMYPYSSYGRAYLQRGTPGNLTRFGESYRLASAEQRANRKKVGYIGRGGYWGRAIGKLFGQGDLGDRIGDIVSDVAKYHPTTAAIANFAGSAPSQQIGKIVADNIPQLWGNSGLYKKRPVYGRGSYGGGVVSNNLVGGNDNAVVPTFNPTDLHTVTYSNREFIKDIYAPAVGSPFSVDTLYINPGLGSTFPWLAQLAINFEEYELVQLIFTFKSTVTDFAAASGQVGQILMATQYNPNSDTFADKEEMMLHEGGMSCKTSESMVHGVECDPRKITGDGQKFVRAGSLPPTEDLKNYDLGKTSIAVLNVPSTYAGQQLGELWVSYTVQLRKPKMASANAYNVPRAVFSYKTATLPRAFGSTNDTALYIASRQSLPVALIGAETASVTIPVSSGLDNLTQPLPTITTSGSGTFRQAAYLEFAPSFSGIVRVRVLTHLTSSAAAVVSYWFGQGNIYRFKDIPYVTQAAETVAWTHIVSSYGDNTDNTHQIDCDIHLRIMSSTNAIPNRIYFGFQNSDGTANTATTAASMCEVTQYNSFLSEQDNGSADRISMQSINGQGLTWA